MNHTRKYHLATEHQELEYKKQLEWASYTNPSKVILNQFTCEVSQIHKLVEYSLSHMITHCPSQRGIQAQSHAVHCVDEE